MILSSSQVIQYFVLNGFVPMLGIVVAVYFIFMGIRKFSQKI